MKTPFRILAGLCLGVLLSGMLYATPAGNLRIVASGNTSTEPKGGWFTGLGERGKTYTMTAAVVSNLMDSASNDLVLSFDTIYISGAVVIDRSTVEAKQFLTLRTNDYATGAIVFEAGASLTLKTFAGMSSTVTLASANMPGKPKVIADQVVLSNVTTAYKRIEMNGFKTWKQWQIDTLLAHADKVGDDIGDGAYDFTNNTLFTIDSNQVFSMTAQTDFLSGKKIGFKNMDRGGTLLPDEYSLGAYPDSFYVDLSNAEGIRFKVNVQGYAESLNIGLSNCLKKGQWHEYCFEYYVYDIPFTAVDKDGYITLPFSMFERVSWGGTWDLSKLIVFIMEAKNVTKGTVISFSDVHGYTTTTQAYPVLMVGNMEAQGELLFSATKANVRQYDGTAVVASKSRINASGNVLLPNPGNCFGSTVEMTASYLFLGFASNALVPTNMTFSLSEMPRYSLDQVWVDNVSKGTSYSLVQSLADTTPHTFEAAFTNAYISLDVEHDNDLCHSEGKDIAPKSPASGLIYHWCGINYTIGTMDTLSIAPYQAVGRTRFFVETNGVYGNNSYNLMRGVVMDVHPEYLIRDTITVCSNSLPYTWKDTIFQEGTVSGLYRLERKTVHGCDSIFELLLTVNGSILTQLADTICDGQAYQKNGFDIAAENTTGKTGLSDTLYRTNWLGCDSVVILQLTINPKTSSELYDTIKQGESYQENGFDIAGTAVGDSVFVLTLVNVHGCDSVVTLHLTTLVNDGVSEAAAARCFSVYPNPASRQLFFEQKDGMRADALRLLDISGRCLQRIALEDTRTSVSLQSLAPGMYYLGVYNENQLITVIKITKE